MLQLYRRTKNLKLSIDLTIDPLRYLEAREDYPIWESLTYINSTRSVKDKISMDKSLQISS